MKSITGIERLERENYTTCFFFFGGLSFVSLLFYKFCAWMNFDHLYALFAHMETLILFFFIIMELFIWP